ncbi:MAG TPA: hypothetical protein PKC97_02455 [Burkholderiaceae bacterium]|jgi:hypothetical protein|nr:hypothetical protein [Burkholderiaceae bacterium]
MDNLSNYPVLAVFYLAAYSVTYKANSYALILGVIACIVLVGLTLLCLSQMVLLFGLSLRQFALQRMSPISTCLRLLLAGLFAASMAFMVVCLLVATQQIVSTGLIEWHLR